VAEALTRITEKMTAQRSAGVELIKTRAIDRPANARLEAEDHETAQVLHTAVTGRKIKRKRTPIHQRGWFVGLGIVALLASIAGLLYLVFKPASPEALFAQAEKLMTSQDPDDWDRAIDSHYGPIPEYFRRYDRIDNDQTARMREWSNLAHVALKERQLANHMRLGWQPQDDAERAAQNGVRNEETGNLPAAHKSWDALLQFKDDAEVDGATWALVAQKHLSDLQAVDELLDRWRRQVAQGRREGKPYAGKDEREQLAQRALHFEMFGDEFGAREVWARVRLLSIESKSKERVWTLLNAWTAFRARDVNPASKGERVEFAVRQLKMAESREDADPLGARIVFRDIIRLYSDTPEFDDVVQRARQHLPSDER
jgi:hypothetical protein